MYFPLVDISEEESPLSEGGHGFTGKAFRVRRTGCDCEEGRGVFKKVDVGREMPEGVDCESSSTDAKRSYAFSL